MSRARWVFFDLETTGTDTQSDRIVSMAFVAGDHGPVLDVKVNPGRPIPAEASAVHGITDDDVRDRPGFEHHAEQVQRLIRGAVLVSYNGISFDGPLLDRELRMAGQPGLDRDEAGKIVQREVDLLGLWKRCEPRTLVSAAMRFAAVDLENAHEAGADAEVLPHVLAGMCGAFGLSTARIDELVEFSRREGAVDREGKFAQGEDGVVRFAFGKHSGTPVHEAPDYLEWMLGKDFAPDTLEHARRFLTEARTRGAELEAERAEAMTYPHH